MKRITDEKRALQPAHLEHPRDRLHRGTGCPALAFHENGAVGHPVFSGVAPSDRGFTCRITRAGSSSQNQEAGKVTIPEIQGMIEPCLENGRRFTRILGCTEYYYRLSGARLIPVAPDEDGGSGDQPERKGAHNHHRQYSANEIYCPFRFCSTRHGWKLR